MSRPFECAVVIPVRDGLPELLDAVESALSQSLAPAEVIVVDDGSTDGSADALRQRFGGRVRILQGRRGGAAAARNAGLRETRAPFVAFLDADDLWMPDKLAVAAAGFAAAGSADWFFSDGEFLTLDGVLHASWFELYADVSEPWCGTALEQLFGVNFVLTSSVVVRRAALEAAGGFDESLSHAEDVGLWIELARRGLATASSRVLVRYRHREGGLSRQTENRLRGGAMLFSRLRSDSSLPVHLRRLARRRETLYHYKLGVEALRAGLGGEARRRFAAAWLCPDRVWPVVLGWVAAMVPPPLIALLRGRRATVAAAKPLVATRRVRLTGWAPNEPPPLDDAAPGGRP